MGIDIEKMRARKEARAAERKGGDRIEFEEGQTLLLIHPPCAGLDEDDLTNGYPYLECVMHFDVGPDKRALASLQQPLLKHPAMVRAIGESFRPFDVEEVGDADPCAIALEDGRLDKKESRAQPRFYWGATPLFHRNKDGEAWKPLTPKPGIIAGGVEIHGGLENAISEIVENYGIDPTSFDGAVYVNVIKGKTGKGEKARVKYDVKFDPKSAREPVVVSPELRQMIEEGSAEGGPLNLFRYCAGSFRSPAAVEAAIDGVDLDEEADAKPAGGKKGKAAAKPAASRKPAVAAADDEAPPDDELDVVAGEEGEVVEGEPAAEEAAADTLYIDEEGYILVSDGGERAIDDNGDPILYQPDENDVVQEEAAAEEPPPPPSKPAVAKPAPKAAPAKPAAAPAKPAAAAAKPAPTAKPAAKPAAPSTDPDADLAAIDAEIDAAASRRPAKPAAAAGKPAPRPAVAAAKPAPAAAKPAVTKAPATVARVSTAAKPAPKPAAAKPAARTVVRK